MSKPKINILGLLQVDVEFMANPHQPLFKSM